MAQSERKVMATRQLGPWTLSAVSNLTGDDLEYCAVEPAPPDDRRPKLVQTAGDAFGVWVDKPASLKLVDNQMVDLQIDRGPVHQSSVARALSESFALAIDKRAVFQALRRGSELVILTQPVLRFSLHGSAEAIDALDDCVRDRGKIAALPSAARGSMTEEAAYAANWFSTRIAPKVPTVRVVSKADAQAFNIATNNVAVAWRVGESSVGTLSVMGAPGADMDDVEMAVTGISKARCAGVYVTKPRNQEGPIGKLMGLCGADVDYHLLFKSKAGFIYVLSTWRLPTVGEEWALRVINFTDTLQQNWP